MLYWSGDCPVCNHTEQIELYDDQRPHGLRCPNCNSLMDWMDELELGELVLRQMVEDKRRYGHCEYFEESE